MQKLRKICCVLIVCAFLLANFFVPLSPLLNSLTIKATKAAEINDGVITQVSQTQVTSKDIGVENGKFTNAGATRSNGLGEVTNWRAIGNTDAPVEVGIVNNTTFYDYIDKTEDNLANPNLSSESALLISGNGKNIGGKGRGFTTNNTIQLYQNSHYLISIMFQTQNGGTASFAITGNERLEENSNSKATGYSTSASTWHTVDFFLYTNPKEDMNINIELWLDGKIPGFQAGTLLVREVSIIRYNHEQFHFEIKNSLADYSKIIDLRNQSILSDGSNNSQAFLQNFEIEKPINLLSFTEKTEETDNLGSSGIHGYINDIPQLPKPTLKNNIAYVDDTNVYSSKQALLFFAVQSSKMAYASAPISIKQQQSYHFSVYAFGNATANIRVTQLGDDGEYIKNKDEYFTVNYSGGEFYNGWSMQSIFIKGHPLKDTRIQVELWMGDKDEGSVGYVWFDHVALEIVDSNYITSSGGSLFDLDPYTSNSPLIANGNFNYAKDVDANTTYPLAAAGGWNEDYVETAYKNGIINTNEEHFNSNKSAYRIPRPSGTSLQPNYTPDSVNNVYLMQVEGSLQSPSIKLNGESYYAVSFEAQIFNSPEFTARLMLDSEIVLSEITTLASSAYKFETYTFYVKTNMRSSDYALMFNIGNSGAVVIDNVSAKLISQTVYENNTHGGYNRVLDLNNVLSTNFYDKLFETKMLDENPLSVVTTTVDNNLLTVSNVAEAHFTVSQLLTDQLVDGEYYKLSFSIRIESLSDGGFIGIRLPGIGDYFKEIKTTNNANVFETYTFFISATYDNAIGLIFEIGDERNATETTFFVKDIKLETSTKTAHQNAVTQLEAKNPPTNILAINNTTPSEETETPKDEPTTSSNPFDPMLIGTIVLIAALVIAVTGVSIRKINFKFHINKKQTTYARDDVDQIEMRGRDEKPKD